jgi:DNA-binding transcriptional regulator LsrR (DeoR family)
MGRSKGDRELAAQRRATAWELYCQSVPQNQIAAQLGISESATSKLIRQAAAVAAEDNPQGQGELGAELHRRWGEAERELRAEIDLQRIPLCQES